MALLTALFATALLMGLGLSLAMLGTSETTLSARDRDARAAAYAARAAAALGTAELRLQPSWATVLRAGTYPELSAAAPRIVDTTLTPTAPWGATLDLRAITTQLQAETDAAGGHGDPITWRLFAYAPIGRVVPEGSPWNRLYLVAWVSDDRADGDGDPTADTNGCVLVHGEALGPDGLRGIVETTIQRIAAPGGGPALVRLLTVRPTP